MRLSGARFGPERQAGARPMETESADKGARPEGRGALGRWWRMGRIAPPGAAGDSEDAPQTNEAELDEVRRRAESALSSARERIESDISAAAPPPGPAAAPEAVRPARGDRWQRGDNAFNEVSRAVHALARGAVRDIRFSMSTRISWNYARILWESLVIALVVLGVTYVFMVLPRMNGLSDALAAQVSAQARELEGGLNALPAPAPTPVPAPQLMETVPPQPQSGFEWDASRPGVRLMELDIDSQDAAYARVSGADGRVYYDDAPFELAGAPLISYCDGEFYYVDSSLVSESGYTYQLCVAVSLSYWLRLALVIACALILIDLVRGAYFLARGRRINAQMLDPIAAMSETARHLNAQNMSERINVEGTRSELRELALVINDMLDRIETAYDGQKQFVSDASHELRTPIAVIQGYAGMLERWGKDDAAVRDEAIGAISKEAANMKELVEKLLFLARHDKQTLRMQSELVDLRALAEDAVRETRMIVSDREIETGEMQDARVLGDATALKQALRIFIDNACKYTPPGGTVTVACRRGGLGVLLSVADTGCGIPASELERIFDRFYRVDDSRGSVPGHGLGLSIARIIAVNHGGKIHVLSREGAGSEFTLDLPGVG